MIRRSALDTARDTVVMSPFQIIVYSFRIVKNFFICIDQIVQVVKIRCNWSSSKDLQLSLNFSSLMKSLAFVEYVIFVTQVV